jgi:phenylacetate-CoA ligase
MPEALSPMKELQIYLDRCREALEIALSRTPMYAAWRALDPGERVSVDERYAALPVLTKSDIRSHFPNGLVPGGMDLESALAREEVCFVHTSGTADESVINIWNQEWWDDSERASWSLNAHAARAFTGSQREAILASALSVGPRSEGLPISREARTLGNYFFLNEFGSTAQWPENHEMRIRAELEEFSPVVLEANPSLLARFARWAWREGKSVFQPELITLTYEFPSEVHLKAIRRIFSSPIASSYGSTEAGYVFMECEQGSLHQNSACCRVDILPVPGLTSQGVGRILATTFGNRWFPLLRFEVGDLARVAPDLCPCGRSLGITLSSIEGRLISLFVAAGNKPVTHRQLDQAMAAVKGIDDYRVDQTSLNRVQLRLVAAEDRPVRSILREAEEMVRDLLGNGVEITAEIVSSLLPEVSGKYLLAKRHFCLDIIAPSVRPGGSSGR